ncbi:hypothetical protein BKA69DRAFT_285185 [Paraphysoderma sedebokerense]|nr:hypothetical protein BKA69DRAFT_285185 [Paraphysoderma sedebokerense]
MNHLLLSAILPAVLVSSFKSLSNSINMLSKQPRLPASNPKFHSQSESSSPSRSTITKRYSHPALIAAPQRKFSLQPSPSPQSTSIARQPLLNSASRHSSSSSSSHKSPGKSISMSLNQNSAKSYSPSTTTSNKTSPLNYRSSSIPVSLNNSPTRLRNVTSPKKELPSTNPPTCIIYRRTSPYIYF